MADESEPRYTVKHDDNRAPAANMHAAKKRGLSTLRPKAWMINERGVGLLKTARGGVRYWDTKEAAQKEADKLNKRFASLRARPETRPETIQERRDPKWGEVTKIDRSGSAVDDTPFKVRIVAKRVIAIIAANGIKPGDVVDARWHPRATNVPTKDGDYIAPARGTNRTIVVEGSMGDDCVFFVDEYERVESLEEKGERITKEALAMGGFKPLTREEALRMKARRR